MGNTVQGKSAEADDKNKVCSKNCEQAIANSATPFTFREVAIIVLPKDWNAKHA